MDCRPSCRQLNADYGGLAGWQATNFTRTGSTRESHGACGSRQGPSHVSMRMGPREHTGGSDNANKEHASRKESRTSWLTRSARDGGGCTRVRSCLGSYRFRVHWHFPCSTVSCLLNFLSHIETTESGTRGHFTFAMTHSAHFES